MNYKSFKSWTMVDYFCPVYAWLVIVVRRDPSRTVTKTETSYHSAPVRRRINGYITELIKLRTYYLSLYRLTCFYDFSNAVAFEQNELWRPPTKNILPVNLQILLSLVKKNYISLWWRITSLWYLKCYIIQQQWTVVTFGRKCMFYGQFISSGSI